MYMLLYMWASKGFAISLIGIELCGQDWVNIWIISYLKVVRPTLSVYTFVKERLRFLFAFAFLHLLICLCMCISTAPTMAHM